MRATLVLAAFAASIANAAVLDFSANGFTIKVSMQIAAPPAEAYRKFVRNIGDWWNPSHTFSGSAKNLSIEEKPMGCFCEKLPEGGVRHMEVITVMPGRLLVMSGALGPMQALAATGNMKVEFKAADGGTSCELTYSVVGYLAGGMDAFAKPSDGMLSDQLSRYKKYVEGK
jgi:uncharacterized protein YndB with AHSA1/START domain